MLKQAVGQGAIATLISAHSMLHLLSSVQIKTFFSKWEGKVERGRVMVIPIFLKEEYGLKIRTTLKFLNPAEPSK